MPISPSTANPCNGCINHYYKGSWPSPHPTIEISRRLDPSTHVFFLNGIGTSSLLVVSTLCQWPDALPDDVFKHPMRWNGWDDDVWGIGKKNLKTHIDNGKKTTIWTCISYEKIVTFHCQVSFQVGPPWKFSNKSPLKSYQRSPPKGKVDRRKKSNPITFSRASWWCKNTTPVLLLRNLTVHSLLGWQPII